MGEELIWDGESADYIRSRPGRYPGGQGIEPQWTQEALDDVDLVTFEPLPEVADGILPVHRSVGRCRSGAGGDRVQGR